MKLFTVNHVVYHGRAFTAGNPCVYPRIAELWIDIRGSDGSSFRGEVGTHGNDFASPSMATTRAAALEVVNFARLNNVNLDGLTSNGKVKLA